MKRQNKILTIKMKKARSPFKGRLGGGHWAVVMGRLLHVVAGGGPLLLDSGSWGEEEEEE